ncbi:hypothetical protein BCV09_13310 [Vibrio cyclitrophicus]|uniref:hypothetical protein n=1 Tax=Vibrio cyclitrophicus TaxID=47951 RepID=UPI000C817627|nr:hypothetical protein [Vibrio cyclitrophicus]PMF63265.1 hypothetical protein BCV09_09955 [Vibrio cyclitrophicus]
MKNNERMIQYFDMDFFGKTYAPDIKHDLACPRTLDELMKEMKSLRELDLARKKITTRSKREFRLEDMEELDDCWVMLINIVDTEAAHPVTNIIGGGDADRRVIKLTDTKGLESSAHLIIYKEKNAAGKHLTLFEKCPSISFYKAASFLNYLFKQSAKHFDAEYRVPHPSGADDKTMKLYCVVNFLAHPSEDFRQELENGIINEITLTNDMESVRGYDSKKHPELKETQIKMNVSKFDVLRSGGNWKHLRRAIEIGDSLDSPFVRVAFSDSTGAGHTATLSTDTGQLWKADKYVKKRKIDGFGNALRTAFPVINTNIRNKMLELVENG